MGWHPEKGFIEHEWEGLNEAMILYVLALGSPTHPISEAAWPARTSGVPRCSAGWVKVVVTGTAVGTP